MLLIRKVDKESFFFFFVVMMKDFKVYLLRVNLYNNVESCINREGQVVSLYGLDNQINILQMFHCDGLLLWFMKDKPG